MNTSPLRPEDPRQIGAYRLVARLGEGGMGSVFLGHSASGRAVAVKVVKPELSTDPEFRERFRAEVRRARQVPPFCTAEVLDADADHATPYLVAELVEGPTLADHVRERGALTGGGLYSVAIGVATALVAIHEAGVVHRDLKPANVLFSPGVPKVIDFGIAKGLDAADPHTVPGQLFGTVAYMGPERFDARRSAEVGPATDVFAWGAVITYAATGRPPFSAETMIAAAAGLPLPKPDLDRLPTALSGLVEAALRVDPEARPTAYELLERLLRAGAAGDPQVRAGLSQRPELRRAAVAVQHTVALVPVGGVPRRPAARAGAFVTLVALGCGLGFAVDRIPVSGPVTGADPAASIGLEARARTDEPASRGGVRGRCTFEGTTAAFTCPAVPYAGNRVVEADVRLDTPGSCAAIRFATAGEIYQVSLCADRLTFGVARPANTPDSMPVPSAAAADWRHLDVRTAGRDLTVSLDRTLLLTRRRALPAPVDGAVTLGQVPGSVGTLTLAEINVAPL